MTASPYPVSRGRLERLRDDGKLTDDELLGYILLQQGNEPGDQFLTRVSVQSDADATALRQKVHRLAGVGNDATTPVAGS